MLLREASARVRGNVGFGDGGHWRAPLSLLCRQIGGNSELSVLGRERLRGALLHGLDTQLLLRSKGHLLPTIGGKIVLVSGLPRSGATLVHNLLALDGQLFAAFDFAEMHDPTAPAIPEPEVRSRLERLKRAMPQV